ncbi:hypothetical protein MLD38_005324 [Melastoma candidum]|uniref:Uncharacterized protein n=1 Tax=Melastoma candidum TaxID=119954 RepID=A0ACB9S7N8_9MYRT|nr:hypothetical protein MLD38_005324 [Melastoma candidum]
MHDTLEWDSTSHPVDLLHTHLLARMIIPGKKRFSMKRKGLITITPLAKKYCLQRHCLFSGYVEGILLDEEGWYPTMPEEEVAVAQAKRCPGRPC